MVGFLEFQTLFNHELEDVMREQLHDRLVAAGWKHNPEEKHEDGFVPATYELNGFTVDFGDGNDQTLDMYDPNTVPTLIWLELPTSLNGIREPLTIDDAMKQIQNATKIS